MYSLWIDHRERAVTNHKETVFTNIKYKILELKTSDYAIVEEETNKICVAIERKSLEDYSASIKDGRLTSQKEKMLKMREETGCSLIYIVEGKHISNPDKKVGNIKYEYIESNIFHTILRDNIQILYSEDTLDTAGILYRLTKSVGTLSGGRGEYKIDNINKTDNTNLLTETQQKRDIDVVRELWSKFPGISSVIADLFIVKYSIEEILRGVVSLNDLRNIKYSNGRMISKKIMQSLSHIDKSMDIKLLATIPGISFNTAKELLVDVRLSALLSYNIDIIAIKTIGKNKKKIGKNKAEDIKKFLSWKINDEVINKELIDIDDEFNYL